MTVAELIHILQAARQDEPVFIFDPHNGWTEAASVSTIILQSEANGRGGFNRPEGDEPTQRGIEIGGRLS